MKLAFTALIPHTLFDDPIDCLHKVLKPMMEAIRDQARDEKWDTHQIRISIMTDTVDVQAETGKQNLKTAVRVAIADGLVEDVAAVH